MNPTDRFARAAIDLYKLTRDDAPESFAACREFVAAEKELTGTPSAYDEQLARGRDAAVADLRAVAEALGCEPNREAMVAAVGNLGKWRQTVLDASDAADPYAARMGLTDAVKAIRGELLSTIVRSYDMRAKLTAAEKARDNLERSVNDLFHAIGYSGNDLDGAVHLAEEQRKAAKSASALTAANLAYGSAEGTLKATIADLRAKLAAADQARKEAADLADHWQSVAERHNTGHESEQIRSELTRPRYEAVADRDGLLADEDDEDDENDDPCPDCGEPAIVGHAADCSVPARWLADQDAAEHLEPAAPTQVAPFDLPALEWTADSDGGHDHDGNVSPDPTQMNAWTARDGEWCIEVHGQERDDASARAAVERARSLLTGEAQAGAEVNHHDLASLLSTMGGIVAALPVAGVRTTVSDILQGRGDLARAVAEVAMSMRVAIDYVAAVFGRHGLTRGEMNAVYRLNTDHETMAAIATRLAMVAITARPDRSADDNATEPRDAQRPVAVLTADRLVSALIDGGICSNETLAADDAAIILRHLGPVALPAPTVDAPVVVAPAWEKYGDDDRADVGSVTMVAGPSCLGGYHWTILGPGDESIGSGIADTLEAAKSSAVASVASLNGARVIAPEQVARDYQDGEASFPWEALTEKERADAIATIAAEVRCRFRIGGAK